jgi:hypothetical protein
MEEHVSDEIYVLSKDSSGGFVWVDTFPLSVFSGNVPAVGDHITLDLYHDHEGYGVAIEEVISRHFVRYISESSGDECHAWFVVVETVETEDAQALASTIGKVFRQEFRGASQPGTTAPSVYEPSASPKLPKSKRISHKMKDPDFWTPERKEAMRKKREARLARMAKLGISDPD